MTPTKDNAVSPVRELRPIEQAFDALTHLARDIRAELEKPGMTIRNVAAFTGVDKSTVLRAKQQKPISADAYIALSLWLNLSRRSLDTADGVEVKGGIDFGDPRPTDCRFRLQDEGKAYPRSSCPACGASIGKGLGRHCGVYQPTTAAGEGPAPTPRKL